MAKITLELSSEKDAKALADHIARTGSVSLSRIVAMPDGHGSLVYQTIKGIGLVTMETP